MTSMEDKLFQKKFNRAWMYKKERKYIEAMELYVELYRQLIKDAFEYLGGANGTFAEDKSKVGEYLKGDNLACTILNDMGVIFAEVGDKQSARKYFEESIRYTPDGINYENPKIGLKELKK